ncbi:MAG: hypothetical protein JJE45_05875, partial [Prolixibacteraceae bacterium]|nr:hypothetical protein [Prolixibacteraceae bacterium]
IVTLNACEKDDYDFQLDNDVYQMLTGTTWVDTTIISSDNYKVTQMTFNDEESFILKTFSYVKNNDHNSDSLSNCVVNTGNYSLKGDTLAFISSMQISSDVKSGNYPVTNHEQESLYKNGIFRFLKEDLKLEYKDCSDNNDTIYVFFHQIDE